MEPFTLKWAAERLDAPLIGPDVTVTAVCTDTRKIEPGALFFALVGEQVDGHRFVAQAFANGAVAAVVSHEVEGATGPLLRVPDTVLALGDLARHYRRQFSIPVVGITGSVGKTSTKEMTATALRARYNTLASEKNYNTEFGVPLTLFRLNREHEVAVIEMGMRGLGQIDRLAEIAEPTIGVITNIGFSHIELLGSQQRIAQAKSELLARLPQDGIAILPLQPGSQIGRNRARHETRAGIDQHGADQSGIDPNGINQNGIDQQAEDLAPALPQNELYAYLSGRVPAGCRIVTYGHDAAKTADVALWPLADLPNGGTAGLAVVRGAQYAFSLQVPGRHNVTNAQAALAVADALAVPVEQALAALSQWQGAEGRMTIRTVKPPNARRESATARAQHDLMVLDDCYNASPESMEVALTTLASIPDRHRVAILGDMKELGDMAQEAHRNVGRQVAELELHTLITVGPLAAGIRDEVRRQRGKRSYPECYHYADAAEAAGRVHLWTDGNVAVLVKGSRAMHMEQIVAALTGETGTGDHG